MVNKYDEMLRGGHHNSLGRTVEVVEDVLSDPERLQDLVDCYNSDDPVVRLRVSSAVKRVAQAQKEMLFPFLQHFLDEVSKIDQPSTKWTFAQLMLMYTPDLSPQQLDLAKEIVLMNCKEERDWIVLAQSMITIGEWAKSDPAYRDRALPVIEHHRTDRRKSVSKKANLIYESLTKGN